MDAYENRLSIDELRREVRWCWDREQGLVAALKEVPEIAPRDVLHLLSPASQADDWDRGKELQRQHGLDVIPPSTECENGAGVWSRIREGLRAPSPWRPISEAPRDGTDVLLYVPSDSPDRNVGRWNGTGWEGADGRSLWEPTNYAPLPPAPPKDDAR